MVYMIRLRINNIKSDIYGVGKESIMNHRDMDVDTLVEGIRIACNNQIECYNFLTGNEIKEDFTDGLIGHLLCIIDDDNQQANNSFMANK